MKSEESLLDRIIRERALRNERTVAIARLAIVGFSCVMDFLGFFRLLPYNGNQQDVVTLVLDGAFVLSSLGIFIVAVRKISLSWMKYVVIGLDFLFVLMMFLFDKQFALDPGTVPMMGLIAGIWVFFLNILRFSAGGMAFAGGAAIAFYAGLLLYFRLSLFDQAAFFMALVFFLFIGTSVTLSTRRMMVEADAKRMLERYVSPSLAKDLFRKKAVLGSDGSVAEAAILFADIRSFTTVAEALPAERVVALLNDYLSAMTDAVFAHGGTIDKFIGDCVMAVFGVPVGGKDDALRAIRTAIAMQEAMAGFNERQSDLGTLLAAGVGIHFGRVVAGSIGSEKRMDYTVIGDSVNLASRIEGLTKLYGCPILVSGETVAAVGEAASGEPFAVREIDKVVVKGRAAPVTVLEIMPCPDEGRRGELARLKEAFEEGLRLYRLREFRGAAEIFASLEGDAPSRAFLERIEAFRRDPPPADWDGSHPETAK